ncbi:MAG: hypothetical protein WCC87_06015 [Candidatus Korobacteraceae bacterium]
MPWRPILRGATGGAASVIVAAVLFSKLLAEKIAAAAEQRFESALKRAEELHRVLLATATTIDSDLPAHRIEVYCEVWKQTALLPQWPRNRELSYAQLRQFTIDLRHWYFEGGGMYLSRRARDAYGNVQEALASVLAGVKQGMVTDGDYDAVRALCSKLRS